MRVAIINTPAHQIAEAHDLPAYPHIGIGYLTAALRNSRINCDPLDAKLERLSIEQVASRVNNGGYDLVGISAMTHDIVMAAALAARVKEFRKDIITVVGGVHATALPQDTLREFPSFDYVVHGEGETAIVNLVNALSLAENLEAVPNIAFRKNGAIEVNPAAPYIEDLDSLKPPEYSHYPRQREYHIITSRGCPYKCIFCMSPYGRTKVRMHSLDRVIEELSILAQQEPRVIKFNDENLIYDESRAEQLFERIAALPLKRIPKVASLRVDRITSKLLARMKSAGFVYVDYGIESGNAEILKIIKKGITLEQAENAIRLTKEIGIKTGANFIIGHPNETMDTAMQTIRWAVKLNADVNAIGLMVPYPGTEVSKMAAEGKGGYRLIGRSWQDYNKQIGNALELETLSRKQLEKLQLYGYLSIYLKNLRLVDLAAFAWRNRRAAYAFLHKTIARPGVE